MSVINGSKNVHITIQSMIESGFYKVVLDTTAVFVVKRETKYPKIMPDLTFDSVLHSHAVVDLIKKIGKEYFRQVKDAQEKNYLQEGVFHA
jgi:hypothetical protein